jgi:hypothetical protein
MADEEMHTIRIKSLSFQLFRTGVTLWQKEEMHTVIKSKQRVQWFYKLEVSYR